MDKFNISNVYYELGKLGYKKYSVSTGKDKNEIIVAIRLDKKLNKITFNKIGRNYKYSVKGDEHSRVISQLIFDLLMYFMR